MRATRSASRATSPCVLGENRGLSAELPIVSRPSSSRRVTVAVSFRGEYQSDGSSCGMWLQAARDAWRLYAAGLEHGLRTFAFLCRLPT